MKSLHDKIDQALIRIGLPPEGRAYLPHITLARFSRGAGASADLAGIGDRLSGPPFQVRHFCLYESMLGAEGAPYSIVERYPLR